VDRLPNLLEYFSYIFYYGTILTGPAFPYKPYQQFIDKSLFENGEVPEGSYTACFTALFHSILCFLGLVVLSTFFSPDAIYKEEFFQVNFFYRFVYYYFAFLSFRTRFYFAWKLAEAVGNINGLGYSGPHKKTKVATWKRLRNVKIFKIEFAGNVRELTTYWNIQTAEWLKNYVYFRQVSNKSTPIPGYATYLTNTLSAFWHGFYPGYYLAFVLAAFTVEQARRTRARFRRYVVGDPPKDDPKGEGKPIYPQKYFYDFFAHFYTLFFFNYGMGTFIGLNMERSLMFYNQVYYCCHIIIAIYFIFLTIVDFVAPMKKRTPK